MGRCSQAVEVICPGYSSATVHKIITHLLRCA